MPTGGSVAVAATRTTEIAVFPFVLDDFSAGVAAGSAPIEASYLLQTTQAAKRELLRLGRYSVVEVGAGEIDVPAGRSLVDCGQCQAAAARKLGGDQALLGVVTKISMVEYTITVQVRDAGDGAIVASCFSGLRMGADYSWTRGVRSLLANCLAAPR
jgi:hypothetical protein